MVDVASYSNRSMLFDASNEFIDFGTTAYNFNGSTAFSVSWWASATAAAGNYSPIAKMSGAGNTAGWCIYHSFATYVYFIIQQTGTTDSLVVYSQEPNNQMNQYYYWSHYVVTYDGSKAPTGVKFYMNGTLFSTNTTTNTFTGSSSNAAKFTIGSRDAGATPMYYPGYLDEIAIWDGYVLLQNDVTTIFNNYNPTNLALFHTPPSSWWRMGEGVVSWPTIPDAIGAVNGTATNMESTDIVDYAHAGEIRLDAEIARQQTIVNTPTVITYYKMTGLDSGAPGQYYHSWKVTNTPDFAGSLAGTLPYGGPLVDIHIADRWQE